jgi:Leucine Rich repeat
MLQINKSIQILRISCNNFDFDCAQLFATILLSNKNNALKGLSFAFSNHMGVNGVSVIVDAVCANPNGCTLTSINFQNVSKTTDMIMETKFAGGFATLLQLKHTQLKELHLGSNDLGDDFATIFFNGLKYNTQLEILNIQGNGITDLGATALANALYYNKTLVELDVSCNYNIGDGGLNAIMTALWYHPSLRMFQFSAVHFFGGIVAELLQYNESLKTLMWTGMHEYHAAIFNSILYYNDTIEFVYPRNMEQIQLLNQNKEGRVAPKKGLRRRHHIYNWLFMDWIS